MDIYIRIAGDKLKHVSEISLKKMKLLLKRITRHQKDVCFYFLFFVKSERNVTSEENKIRARHPRDKKKYKKMTTDLRKKYR